MPGERKSNILNSFSVEKKRTVFFIDQNVDTHLQQETQAYYKGIKNSGEILKIPSFDCTIPSVECVSRLLVST